MTIATTQNTQVFQGNGATTSFSYNFLMDDASHAVVIYTDPNGNATTLPSNAYSITGIGNKAGGTLTYTPSGNPIPNGSTLTLSRQLPFQQNTGVSNQGNFYPAVIEAALDYLTMLAQQMNQALSRALVAPLNLDTTKYGLALPVPVANTVLGWDAAGLNLVNIASFAAAGVPLPLSVANGGTGAGTMAAGLGNLGLRQNVWCGNSTGTANAIVLTPVSAPATAVCQAGDSYTFKASATNTGATTVNPNGFGVTAVQLDGTALTGGEIQTGKWYRVTYDGAAFQLYRLSWLGAYLNAKGALLSATAAGVVATVPVGAAGAALVADPTQTSGLNWVILGAGSVRQSILSAKLDANGYNASITTGAGLRPGLAATGAPAVATYASGFGANGSQDLVATASADVADVLGHDLRLSNTSFLYTDYVSPTSETWNDCLIPPQYGYAFDRTAGALLNFEGVNGSTTILDDFGNTWTAFGSAQISTAQFKFGTSSLLLNGTTDYVKTNSITTFGDGSWEMSAWFRITALPGSGANAELFRGVNTTPIGLDLRLVNTAGTTKLNLFISSDGTTWNVANAAAGTNTGWTLGQWNKVRLVFDALSGTYKVYLSLNGAAETVDISVASTAKVCAITTFGLGATAEAPANFFNGSIDAFRFIRGATNTSAETPAAVAPAITDHKIHFFSIPQMKMYEVTGASSAANTDPVMTQRNRLFRGECDTGAATITAVRPYALRGEYRSVPTPVPGASITTRFSDNLGIPPEHSHAEIWYKVQVNHSGLIVGAGFKAFAFENPGGVDVRTYPDCYRENRNTSVHMTGSSGMITWTPLGNANATGANDRLIVVARRTF